MLTAVDQLGIPINMLIDRSEHVLSPAAAPVSAASYACVRLCMLPRYLDALVQFVGPAAELARARAARVVLIALLGG